jgi:hypothetical protein
LAREGSFFEDRLCTGLQGEYLVRAEVRLKVGEQVRVYVKSRELFVGNPLSAEIPDHGTEFVVFVEANPMINAEKSMRFCFEKNMAALAVCIV